ncbi:hypothetical protein TRAPUB_11575, partial [Trametes pubescens]
TRGIWAATGARGRRDFELGAQEMEDGGKKGELADTAKGKFSRGSRLQMPPKPRNWGTVGT